MQLIQLRQNHIDASVNEFVFSTFSFERFEEILGTPIFQKSSEWLLPCNNELRHLSIKWKSVDKICEILFWYFLLFWWNMTMTGESWVKTQILILLDSDISCEGIFFFFSKAAGLQFATLLIINFLSQLFSKIHDETWRITML